MPALNRAAESRELARLIQAFLRAETDIVNEIARLRQRGLVDYHAEAALERVQTDGEAARRLRQRVAELMPMWREMRELATLTGRYYDRSYHKNEKYTI